MSTGIISASPPSPAPSIPRWRSGGSSSTPPSRTRTRRRRRRPTGSTRFYPRLMVQNQYTNIGGRRVVMGLAHRRRRQPDDGCNVDAVGPCATTRSTSPAATVAREYGAELHLQPRRHRLSLHAERRGSTEPATWRSVTPHPTPRRIRNWSYAGRLAGDPVNSITQTEQLMFAGTGSQSGTCGGTCERWGDYSAMTLDPDGCKFWYTNEYYVANGLKSSDPDRLVRLPLLHRGGRGRDDQRHRDVHGGRRAGRRCDRQSRRPHGHHQRLRRLHVLRRSLPERIPALPSPIPVTTPPPQQRRRHRRRARRPETSRSRRPRRTAARPRRRRLIFQGGLSTNLDLTVSPGDVQALQARPRRSNELHRLSHRLRYYHHRLGGADVHPGNQRSGGSHRRRILLLRMLRREPRTSPLRSGPRPARRRCRRRRPRRVEHRRVQRTAEAVWPQDRHVLHTLLGDHRHTLRGDLPQRRDAHRQLRVHL